MINVTTLLDYIHKDSTQWVWLHWQHMLDLWGRTEFDPRKIYFWGKDKELYVWLSSNRELVSWSIQSIEAYEIP